MSGGRTGSKLGFLVVVGIGLLAINFLRDNNPDLPDGIAGVDVWPTTTQVVPVTAGQLATLTVVAEDQAAAQRYDRGAWGDWATVDGCDTREQVLLAASESATRGKGCTPVCPSTTGPACWVSPYDGVEHWDKAGLDIDHLVPLAEAQASGAGDWTAAQREAFANDPNNLVAVTDSLNQAKSDGDPGEWLPPDIGYRITYAQRYAGVKAAYGLSVDEVEYTALAALLDGVR